MQVYEGTGITARPSKDFGVISANIAGNAEKLQFTRHVFYSFGIRCEGCLNNILEEGMEVDFCYRLSPGKPKIIAVWLGDKPDLPLDTLDGVYRQRGRVSQVLDDYYVVQSETMAHTVLVSHEVVHPISLPLAVGDDVMFDAVPLDYKHESGAVYQGTCAWVGEEPILALRFRLDMSESLDSQDTVELHSSNHVHGNVVDIPNGCVAIVEVMGFRKKAVLFRRSFGGSYHERIQDIVSIGDTVCMIIRSRCKLWFAVRAYKECVELGDESSEPCEPMQKNDVVISDPPLQVGISQSLADADALCVNGKPGKTVVESNSLAGTPVIFEGTSTSRLEAETQSASASLVENPPGKDTQAFRESDEEGPREELVSLTFNAAIREPENLCGSENLPKVLFGDPPLQGILLKTVYSNLGLLSYGPSNEVGSVRQHDFYIDGNRCYETDQFQLHFRSGETEVNFEGVLLSTRQELGDVACSFRVTCAWIGEKPSLRAVTSNMNKASADILVRSGNPAFYGVVSSFYLPNIAFVSVKGMLKQAFVCLHLSTFLSELNKSTSFITDFVGRGTCLSMKLADDAFCEIPVRADTVEIISEMEMKERVRNAKARYPELYTFPQKPNLRQISGIQRTLFSNPPLSGKLNWHSNNQKGIIVYEGLEIEFEHFNLFLNGRMCNSKKMISLVKDRSEPVNFEAIQGVNIEGNLQYYASVCWYGKKPSLLQVAKSVQGPPAIALPFAHRTFFGYVMRLYFPSDALLRIKVGDKPTVVCLHANAFASAANWRDPVAPARDGIDPVAPARDPVAPVRNWRDPVAPARNRRDSVALARDRRDAVAPAQDGRDPVARRGVPIISDFVHYKEYLTFKVRRNPNCHVGLCAYDVEKSDEGAYHTFCAASKHWNVK